MLRFLNLAYGERESTMSFGARRRDLLSPTQWLAITYAIAAAVNLREELTTLLMMKAMLASSLHSVARVLSAHNSLAAKIASSFTS